MPFGICSASEVLQKRYDKIFGHLRNVHVIQDDIIISGIDEREHDEALAEVLREARKHKVRFSEEKVQFRITSVKYMGHIISWKGLTPDPHKVKAITEMAKPKNSTDIQR